MRPGQKNRMRGGRGNNGGRRGPNPLTRSYESNGPDVKVRGTPQHIAEKYVQLARDAHSSGDTVMAESYLQHAEHYYRIIAAAQLAQQQAYNLAHGLPVNEADQIEDEDEFEVAGADRFTFRAPQSFQQQNGHGGHGHHQGGQAQPFGADPAQADQPVIGEGGGGEQGPFQPHQNQPRGDRPPFGARRFEDRNHRRFGRDRNERGFGGDRPRHDRPQGEAPRPADVEAEGVRRGAEEAHDDAPTALPSFITAPARPAETEMGDDGAPGAGFRPRRRRRGRGGEGRAEPEAPQSEE